MYPPPPRDRPYLDTPSWSDLGVTYALVAALPVVLWAVSNPVASIAGVATGFGLRRAYLSGRKRLKQGLRDRTVSVQLGQTIHIRITRPGDSTHPQSDACCT